MSRAGKGSQFERDICRQLSTWWTYGEQDDVFWRSSQSGGRATVRARKGLRTAGSYGDIAALDPIGEPLIKTFTIELKRGNSHGNPADLLDCTGDPKCNSFVKTLIQAEEAHKRAKSKSWLIILKRDFKHPVVFFPSDLTGDGGTLFHARPSLYRSPVFRFRVMHLDFMGSHLDKFLHAVDPATVAEAI